MVLIIVAYACHGVTRCKTGPTGTDYNSARRSFGPVGFVQYCTMATALIEFVADLQFSPFDETNSTLKPVAI